MLGILLHVVDRTLLQADCPQISGGSHRGLACAITQLVFVSSSLRLKAEDIPADSDIRWVTQSRFW